MNIREWTLPVYTILTQLSVGTLFLIWVIRAINPLKISSDRMDEYMKIPVLIMLSTAVFSILFAHLHLSQPNLSFLALRNLKSSWLSRELLSNMIYIFIIVLLVFSLWSEKSRHQISTVLGWLAILAGFATDYCMARVYLLLSQPFWNTLLTPISFLTNTFLLGAMTVPVLFSMDLIYRNSKGQSNKDEQEKLIETCQVQLVSAVVGLCILTTLLIFLQIKSLLTGSEAAQTSLDLLLNIYQPLLIVRLVMLYIGMGWSILTVVRFHKKSLVGTNLLQHFFGACLLMMVAEIIGRFLFYAIHVRIGI